MNRIVAPACLAVAVFTAGGCLLISVSKHDDHQPARVMYSPAPASTQPASRADLELRYQAGMQMSSLTSRDHVMGRIAVDAAASGEVEMAQRSLAAISSLTTRDDAANAVAITLAHRGMRTEALDVARGMCSLTRRDQTLARLASE